MQSNLKSLLKAISWRIWATLTTWVTAFLVTKSITISTTVSSVEFVFKILFYYVHERIWEKLGRDKLELSNNKRI